MSTRRTMSLVSSPESSLATGTPPSTVATPPPGIGGSTLQADHLDSISDIDSPSEVGRPGSIGSLDDDDAFLEKLRNDEFNKKSEPRTGAGANSTLSPGMAVSTAPNSIANILEINTDDDDSDSEPMVDFDEENDDAEVSSGTEIVEDSQELDPPQFQVMAGPVVAAAENEGSDSDDTKTDYDDDGVTAVDMEPRPTMNPANVPLHPLPHLPKGCFLSDGTSMIDMIIEFDVKKGGKEKYRNKIYRTNYANVLRKLGLVIETAKSKSHKNVEFLKVHAPYEFLAMNAEMIGLRVPIDIVDFDKKPSLTTRAINMCCRKNMKQAETERPLPRYYCMRFDRDQLRCFLGYKETDSLFSVIQRIQIVNSTIQRTTIKKLKRSWKSDDGAENISDEDEPSKKGRKELEDVSYEWLKLNGVFTAEYPLHDCSETNGDWSKLPPTEQPVRRWLLDNWGGFHATFRPQPLDWIRAYFGTQIGLYFAWLGFYTKWLAFPAFFSIVCLLFGIRNVIQSQKVADFCSDSAKHTIICRQCPSTVCPFSTLYSYCQPARFGAMFDNETTCIFAIVISLWSVLFVEFWKRYQNLLASRWEGGEEIGDDMVRPEFLLKVRTKRTSPITKEEESYVPLRERLHRLASSVTIIASMILLLLILLISTIIYRSVAAIILSTVADSMAGISASLLASVTSAILSLIVIQLMSQIYPRVARMMTEYERPKTDNDFETSYTYKVICFQYVNFYGSLFYLAFFRGRFESDPGSANMFSSSCSPAGCLMELSVQLIIIMTAKQTFQNCMEIGIPKIKKWIKRCRQGKERKNAPRWEDDRALSGVPSPVAFDDYTEMLIQYGFLTMFAPAFPVAALFAWINNILEIRIDAYKYLSDVRRIVPKPITNIGAWQEILESTTRFAVVVNAFIIAFTSRTLDAIYYETVAARGAFNGSYLDFTFSKFDVNDYPEELRNLTDSSEKYCYYSGMFHGKENNYERRHDFWYLFLTRIVFVLIFEHAIFLIQSLVQGIIPDVPESVGRIKLREQFLQKQKFMQQEYGRNFEEKLEEAQVLDSGDQNFLKSNGTSTMAAMSKTDTPISDMSQVLPVPPEPEPAPKRSRFFRRRRINPGPQAAPTQKASKSTDGFDEVDLTSTISRPKNLVGRLDLDPDSVSKSLGSMSTLRKRHGRRRASKRQRGHFMGRMLRRLAACDM